MFEVHSMKVLNKIGEGLSSEVFRVRIKNRVLGSEEEFAFKLLKNESSFKLFKKEFENLSKALGKRLPRLYGWKKIRGRYGLVMDLIEGVELTSLNMTLGLSSLEIDHILDEVKAGLLELQSVGLFHGDLSPRNVLVDKNGEVKLIDFGLTRWKTERMDVTPQFAAASVLKGEFPNLSTDLESLEILSKYLRQRVEKFQGKRLDPRETLAKKVEELRSRSLCRTSVFSENEQSKSKFGSILTGFGRWCAPLTFAMLSVFPLNLARGLNPSHIFLKHSFDGWIALKAPGGERWCFSPCRLSLESNLMHHLRWKTSSKYGFHDLRLEPGESRILHFKEEGSIQD